MVSSDESGSMTIEEALANSFLPSSDESDSENLLPILLSMQEKITESQKEMQKQLALHAQEVQEGIKQMHISMQQQHNIKVGNLENKVKEALGGIKEQLLTLETLATRLEQQTLKTSEKTYNPDKQIEKQMSKALNVQARNLEKSLKASITERESSSNEKKTQEQLMKSMEKQLTRLEELVLKSSADKEIEKSLKASIKESESSSKQLLNAMKNLQQALDQSYQTSKVEGILNGSLKPEVFYQINSSLSEDDKYILAELLTRNPLRR